MAPELLVLARMKRLALALAFTACSSSDDIVGPFSGSTHRFVVDGFTLPVNGAKAHDLGGDLDGDGLFDNQIGMLTSTLAGTGNLNLSANEMIRAGVLSSVVEIVANDLTNDPAVGVYLYGAAGDAPTPAGGMLVDGTFRSNRTATSTSPGKARLRLPVFASADPSEIEIVGMEVELYPDGRGGYHAHVAGGLRVAEALAVAHDGTAQLLASDPQEHRAFWFLVDTNHDGVLAPNESTMLASLLEPDVEIWYDGRHRPAVSIGFGLHLRPCAEGACLDEPVGDRCVDRLADGDESDVDCGGSCLARCGGGLGCRVDADCQSGRCDAGICTEPSCDNGRLDGFEASVDCGGGCAGCAVNQRCQFDEDCASGSCADNHACY